MNRGEDLKVLSVKVNVPETVKHNLGFHVRHNLVRR